MKELVEYLGNLVNFNPANILLWRLSQFNDRPTQSITDSQGKVGEIFKGRKNEEADFCRKFWGLFNKIQ